jgi:hypothetical protein
LSLEKGLPGTKFIANASMRETMPGKPMMRLRRPLIAATNATISRSVYRCGPPSSYVCRLLAPPCRQRTIASTTSSTNTGCMSAFGLASGKTNGIAASIDAKRFKNESPGPKITEGLKIVQSTAALSV